MVCEQCRAERLVAFSCKARSCPSCNARRMEDAADHLVRNVFPVVRVRQWVLSLPRNLRFLAAREPNVASRLLEIFTRTLFAWQRRAARRTGVADPRTTGVTAVQRFGGAGLGLTEAALMEYCRGQFTGYKKPKFIEFRDELPKTNVGKILRRELRDAAPVALSSSA